MRIGFEVTPLALPQSGVGTYTLNLLCALWARRADALLMLSNRPPLPEHRLALAGLPLLGEQPRLNKSLWMQLLLPWQLRHAALDVAHFTNSVAPLFCPCPTVLTIHDMTLWLYPDYHPRRRLLAMRPLIPLAARRAALILTVSESARADIVRLLKVPAAKVHVVYAAAAPLFEPLHDRERLEQVRRHYALDRPFILYVGTLEPRKNLVRLLEAFAGLRARAALPHQLLLVGNRGWKEAPIFAAVERLGLAGAVRFLHHVPTRDLVALYSLAELLAFPSLYEGFGLPVVEAMACGTPVLTSHSGSLCEVAGGAAQLVEPTEVESIVEGLWALLGSPARCEQLRERGLARAAQFSWPRAAAESRALYATVGAAP